MALVQVPLACVSPIDGRYHSKTDDLSLYFSEAALQKYRLIVEIEYFKFFIKELLKEEIGPGNLAYLNALIHDFDLDQAQIVKDIEERGYEDIPATNHDVKAVEYYIKLKLKGSSLEKYSNYIHFGLTSEDVTNLAYGLAIGRALEVLIIPTITELISNFGDLAQNYSTLPMMARTHGQPASPTTFGKEINVFVLRLRLQLDDFFNYGISVKLNGASGNYCAHHVAFPEVDWLTFSVSFIAYLFANYQVAYNLNEVTTQIEPHDTYAELFDGLKRINTILIDFCQDMWRYISDEWVVQKPVEGEVGSSTMPHKVNPIDFENAEGNLGLANAIGEFFSRTLPISRLQRHLSDSTLERNFGVVFAHSLIAYKSILKGLGKIKVNEDKIREVLNSHPEILAEAIQTILRREGLPMPYEQLKALTRGKKVTMADITKFIDELDISPELKAELHQLRPDNYLGLATGLAEQ